MPRPKSRPTCEEEERGALAQSIGRLWRSITGRMEQTGELSVLQPHQFWVLGVLSAGPRRMKDLAEITRTSSANVTGLVDRLAERGLVERSRSQEDRRVVVVSLTAAGRELMREGRREFCRLVDEVLAPLTADEQRELHRLITKAVG